VNAARRRKLGLIIFLLSVLAAATALVTYALRQNISLFYTPSQVSQGTVALGKKIRLGGMVVAGSVHQEGLLVRFKLSDYRQTVTVVYQGILPDLFREGQGIVAEGVLVNQGELTAQVVLAKHDANYMPKEVKAALAQNALKGQAK